MKKRILPIYFVFLVLSFQAVAQHVPSEALFAGDVSVGLFGQAVSYAKEGQISASYAGDFLMAMENQQPSGITGALQQQPGWSFKVFPNPVRDELRVVYQFESEAEVVCELRDITGKKVMEENLKIPGGKAETTLNLSDLREGIYFIKFSSPDKKQQQIIKIQKL